jgi:large subunit ribosomal protein L13
MQRQTTFAKPGKFEQGWHIVDAEGQSLGRLAAAVAQVLMGKHRPIYTPFVDSGEFVIVINADKVRLTGRKAERNFHQTYSRYPGGQKSVSWGELLEKKPERLIELATRRMLPKSQLGQKLMKKLRVFRGAEHPHGAQQPKPLAV